MRFTVPTRVILGKNKKTSFPLNANTFANKHHRQKHNAKMQFYEYMESLNLTDKVGFEPYDVPIRLHLKFYKETGGTFDIDNTYFGIHKFVADALSNLGVIHDDNYKHVKHGTFEFMGVQKSPVYKEAHLKGRCDIIVEALYSE